MRTCSRILVVALAVMITAARVGVAAELYPGPVIDAHSHLGASFDWDTMVRVMDRNNVSRQIVMARYYPGPTGSSDLSGNDELALKRASKYSGRFFPLVGMQRPELTGANKWRNPDADVEAVLNGAEGKLAAGRFSGIGEVIVRHFAYTSGKHAEEENSIYSPFIQR